MPLSLLRATRYIFTPLAIMATPPNTDMVIERERHGGFAQGRAHCARADECRTSDFGKSIFLGVFQGVRCHTGGTTSLLMRARVLLLSLSTTLCLRGASTANQQRTLRRTQPNAPPLRVVCLIGPSTSYIKIYSDLRRAVEIRHGQRSFDSVPRVSQKYTANLSQEAYPLAEKSASGFPRILDSIASPQFAQRATVCVRVI